MTRSQPPALNMAYNYTRDEQLYGASIAGWSPARQQANLRHDVREPVQNGFTPTTMVYPVNPSAGQGQSHLSAQMHSQKPNDGWPSGHNLPADVDFIALNSTSQQHSANVPYYGSGSPAMYSTASASEKYNSDHYGYQSAQSNALPESRTHLFPPHSSMPYYSDALAEEATWVGMNYIASGLNVASLSPWDSPSTDFAVSPFPLTAEFGGTAAAYPMMPHEISKHRVATDAVERVACMKRRSSDTNKLVKCTVPGCFQTFTAKHNLNFHLQSHRGVKVQCSQCGNEFAPSSLKRHQDKSCPGRRRI
ncbi:hypothetical protein D9758_003882 [Tetrapyrgos nigripes]|uniref:C2H2-type domain-containing protein n=1 Tax=Tetrapyrgos nigripes TaxID=182062 RepID=A0A8H5LRP0_9AGAR|nr:hypothetical protein D9758_003882 [Tetrapyrgos nigripes]